jgi:hypothetical protein
LFSNDMPVSKPSVKISRSVPKEVPRVSKKVLLDDFFGFIRSSHVLMIL